MNEYQAVHLMAHKDKLAAQPSYIEDLAKSVVVQGGESQAAPGMYVGVLVYMRQDGRLFPERLNPFLYLAAISEVTDRLVAQAIDVGSTPYDQRKG